ncbi:MAG: helix-turn-helix transcriptional regulator [Pirellulales bacterium]|nr:helix-turn-helix transcriptional regulator [Pirellulales bacterium]
MARKIVEFDGTRYVLVLEAELAALEGRDFPSIAEDGTCEALSFIRASIAQDIVRERRRLGMTQMELAEMAGIRQETLSRLEGGKHRPNVRTIERIEAALTRRRSRT